MSDRSMKQAIYRLIAVSTAFLLGGLSLNATAQNCAPATGDQNVAIADELLKRNESRRAYAYLNLAREQGSGEAYRYTAEMFEKGKGVATDPAMARHMFSFGAQSNDAESMFRTASDFYERGLKKDGERWAHRAKDCGHMGAVMLLVKQAAQDRRNDEARSLLSLAIDAGFSPAKFYLAEVYDKGQLGFEKDYQSAFKWYYMAAKDGHADGMAAVAYYFARGIHGVQDDVASIHWYHEAARAGHIESWTAYGWMLANGKGTQVDIQEAKRVLTIAKNKGDRNAIRFLADIQGISSQRRITSYQPE